MITIEMVINSTNFFRSISVKKTMATNHQSSSSGTTGSGGGPRLSGIGSPTLGGGTPVKACKKVLPPAIPLEFLQRRNSQNLRKDDETPTNAEVILPQQQQQQTQMTTAIVHQQPEGQLIESLEDSALGYYATSNGKLWEDEEKLRVEWGDQESQFHVILVFHYQLVGV